MTESTWNAFIQADTITKLLLLGMMLIFGMIMIVPRLIPIIDRGQKARLEKETEERKALSSERERLINEVAALNTRLANTEQSYKDSFRDFLKSIQELTAVSTTERNEISERLEDTQRRREIERAEYEHKREEERKQYEAEGQRVRSGLSDSTSAIIGLTQALNELNTNVETRTMAQEGRSNAVKDINTKMETIEQSITGKIRSLETKVDEIEKHLQKQDENVQAELDKLRDELKELKGLIQKILTTPPAPVEVEKKDVPDPSSGGQP